MKKYMIIITMFLMILTLQACTKGDKYKPIVSGDFIYSKVGIYKEGEVAIIGISEEGKTKETLVFPTYIDGYRVISMGTNYINTPSAPIIFDYAKNIYFSSQYGIMITWFIYDYKDELLESQVNIFVGGEYLDARLYSTVTDNKDKKHLIYSAKASVDNVIDPLSTIKYAYANVGYYLSDDKDDLFFVDDVDGTKVNVIPPNPYKEGYEFKGWYKDLTYQEVWDFETDIIPTKQYDSEGNYILEETRIYAKWDKI